MRSFIISLILLILWIPQLSHSYWIHGVTGDLLPYGQIKVLPAFQLIRSPVTTIGVFTSIEKRIHDSAQLVGSLSLGGNLEGGVFYKWVPIPDYQKQPAMGVLAGISYGRIKKEDSKNSSLDEKQIESLFTIKGQPFLSKYFQSAYGTFNAYVAIPVGIEFGGDDTEIPIKIAVGSEMTFPDQSKVFLLEIGVNLIDSSTSVLFGLNFNF